LTKNGKEWCSSHFNVNGDVRGGGGKEGGPYL